MVEFDFRAMAWPAAPLDAAAFFHSRCVPQLREMLAGEGMWQGIDAGDAACVILPAAGHEHDSWRVAAIEELAREAAPVRINGVVDGQEEALAQVIDYLESAPGVTGQLLAVAAGSV